MIEIEQFTTDEATEGFLNDLKELLTTSFGNQFSDDDWEHGLNGRHFAVFEAGSLVAHCAVVARTLYIDEKNYLCGYLENVATIPHRRLHGFAALAVREANQYISTHFEIGALSTSKSDFYRKLDWKIWSGPTFVLTDGEWIPSDDEHGGIMILKTDLAPDIDLNRRIACESRSGDSW